jgi:hypothetical protein
VGGRKSRSAGLVAFVLFPLGGGGGGGGGGDDDMM